MLIHNQKHFYHPHFATIIDTHPLIIPPQNTVLETIRLLNNKKNTCLLTSVEQSSQLNLPRQMQANCALVMDQGQLLGLLTEQEVVNLAVAQNPCQSIPVTEVMKRDFVSVRESDCQDIFTILQLFHQQHLDYLPILDDEDKLLGIITPQSILRTLKSTNLLQQRSVTEVMNADLVYAPPHTSLLAIAKLMIKLTTDYVAIAPELEIQQLNQHHNQGKISCVGIITKQDLVQFQALELDLVQLLAQNVIAKPLPYLKSSDSLWSAYQTLNQHSVQCLMVNEVEQQNGQKSLKTIGVVNHSDFLRVLDPIEVCNFIQASRQEKVNLTQENVGLLKNRNQELEQQLEKLATQLRQQTTAAKIAKQKLQQEVAHSKKLVKSLSESELRYRKVVDKQTELVCRFSPELTLTFVNEAYCTHCYLSAEQLIGQNFLSVIPPENRPLMEIHLNHLGWENPTGMIEYQVTTQDGEVLWLEWSNQVIFNQQGQIVEFQSVGRNITQRRKIEIELQKSQARLTGILDLAEDAIITIDANQHITLFNQGAEKMFRYTTQDILGKTIDILLPEQFTPLYRKYLAQCHKSATKVHQPSKHWEMMGCRQDGSKFPVEASISQFCSGEEIILTVILRDISERKQHETMLAKVNTQLNEKINELEQRNQEMNLLASMSDFLQACQCLEEAYVALPNLVKPLFPGNFGGVFLVNMSGELFEVVAGWGEQLTSQTIFSLNDCWALRRSRTYWVEDTQSSVVCKHVDCEHPPAESLCVPMMAQGKALGLFYLSSPTKGVLTEAKRQLAAALAEHIALALANLQLREELHFQSIRDPLTGLFNRRYLEESLKQLLHYAKRKQQPLGMIILDVDHFKRFNDTYGHEAGDLVLQKISSFLQANIRGSDIACRYGGEEMLLILPEASLENTRQRAEQLREGIKKLQLRHKGQSLGKVTVSLGVACYPEHGSNNQELFDTADGTLYQAKAQGRDRVVSA